MIGFSDKDYVHAWRHSMIVPGHAARYGIFRKEPHTQFSLVIQIEGFEEFTLWSDFETTGEADCYATGVLVGIGEGSRMVPKLINELS